MRVDDDVLCAEHLVTHRTRPPVAPESPPRLLLPPRVVAGGGPSGAAAPVGTSWTVRGTAATRLATREGGSVLIQVRERVVVSMYGGGDSLFVQPPQPASQPIGRREEAILFELTVTLKSTYWSAWLWWCAVQRQRHGVGV